MDNLLARLLDGYRELKRRHVIRVAAAYVVAAWVGVQVAAVVFPALTLPRWTVTAAVLLALAGFPVAVVLAWVVEPVPDSDASLGEDTVVDGGEESTPAHGYRVAHPLGLLLLVIAVVSVTGWLVWRGRPLELSAFPARGWVVLADFRAETADTSLAPALTGGLELSLAQSPHVNLFPRGRIREVLRRMRRTPDTELDIAAARQVARREGGDLVLAPTVAGVGGRFRLGVRVVDPESGEALRVLTARADRREDLLDALDELATDLREVLGETRLSVRRRSEPLEQVTTSSLQALEQYSRARRAHVRNDFGEARRLYGNAVREDSAFVTAVAALGMLEFERFDRAKGRKLLRRAVEGMASLSDRERYGVLTAHAIAVEGDLDAAHRHQRALADLYPDNYVAHSNLGRIAYLLGRHREAASSYQRALDIYPGLGVAASGLYHVMAFELGRLDSALAVARNGVTADSANAHAWMQLGMGLFALDSLEEAAEHLERSVELAPERTLTRLRLAHLYRISGRHDEAIATLEGILQEDSASHQARYDLGVSLAEAGRDRLATAQFERNLSHWTARTAEAEGARPLYHRAALHVRMGDDDLARTLLERAVDADSTLYFDRARVRTLMEEEREAVQLLRRAVEAGFDDFLWMKLHPDLQSLRGRPAFRSILREALLGGRDPRDDRPREPAL